MIYGILDNQEVWLRKSAKMLHDFLDQHDIEGDILTFDKADKLLKEIHSLDVVFMDIELKEQIDGIEVSKQINALHPDCQIVYVSAYLSYAMDVYDTDHSYFVVKDQFEDRLKDIIRITKEHADKSLQKLSLHMIGEGDIYQSVREIRYFERNRRETIVHTTQESYRIWDKLDSLLEQLPEGDFIRCHTSYMVNLNYVREYSNERFTLDDGIVVLISRKYRKEVADYYRKWLKQQLY